MRTSLRTFTIAVSLACAFPAGSWAQTYWQVADGGWSTGASWSAGEPSAVVNAFINNGGLARATSPGEVCNNLYLGMAGGESGSLAVYNAGALQTQGYLEVGASGQGTVTHLAGPVTVGSTLNLGNTASGNGIYNVSGTGQLGADYIAVGSQGTGELSVATGADATCLTGYIGRWSGSTGTATVDGAGSTWTATNAIYVSGREAGAGGTGTLTIDNGGEVDAGTLLKAWGGEVNVTSGTLRATTVELVGGADLNTAGTSTLRFDTATVTGAGSTWTHPSTLKIDTHSNSHTDSVAVSDGGALSSLYGWVGYNNGYTGSVTVDDLDSTWDVTNNLTVGYYGTGTLTLTGESVVSCASLDIGRKSTGNGTVTVGAFYPDCFAELNVAGNANIGPEGTGLLDIVDRNHVDVGGVVTIHPGGTLNLEGGLYADELALLAGGTYQDLYSEALRINRLTGFGDSVNLDSAVQLGHNGGSGTHTVGLGQSFACNALTVGYDSTADLIIEHGGDVSTAFGNVFIGDLPSADGTITVRHSGSRLDTGGELRVGDWGQGALNVLDGGFVTAPDLLSIGHEGPGQATVDGGTITATNGPVSVGEGSASGTLTVSNSSLIEWNAGQALSIGANGTVSVSNSELTGGPINVTGGGSLSSDGGSTLNVGAVTVDGAGSSWAHPSTLKIDTHTTGPDSVVVSGGGALSCLYGWAGYNTGHTGSVTVTGPDSTWDVTNNLTVGYYGTGTLTITDEAEVNCAGLDIGRKSTGNGTVTVGAPFPDTSAGLNVTGDVNIGPEGVGLLSIVGWHWARAGGTVTIHPGGTLDLEGSLYADELALLPGGTYQGSWGNLYVNRLTGFGDSVDLDSLVRFGHSGGSGTHTVGAGQTFTCNGLSVGYNSTAEFVIENGGQVLAGSGDTEVGDWSGGDGTLTVRHSGSRLDTFWDLQVGGQGQGKLYVLDGGVVTTVDVMGIGSSGSGEVTVNDGTISVTDGGVYVGVNTAGGTLTVSNGSLVEWNAGDPLRIGTHGTVSVTGSELSGGSIEVIGGGSFSSDAASDLNVGSVSVAGGGSTWTHAGTLAIDTGLGIPSLSIALQGSVDVNGTLAIGTGGSVVLDGGVLQADTVNDPGTGTMTFSAGRLSVGTYQGNLSNQGGTAAPGLSPGTMTVTGNYTQSAGGALEIEIAAATPGQWDVLAVAGTANLDGALEVVLDGYTPAAGDSFEVLTWGSRSGTFATITGWEDATLAMPAIYGPNELMLHATHFGDATLDGCVDGLDYVIWSNNYLTGDTWQEGDFNDDLTADGLDYVVWSNNYLTGCPGVPGQVPEPSSAVLLALGLLALRRRLRA